jgi:hypothetical protein
MFLYFPFDPKQFALKHKSSAIVSESRIAALVIRPVFGID